MITAITAYLLFAGAASANWHASAGAIVPSWTFTCRDENDKTSFTFDVEKNASTNRFAIFDISGKLAGFHEFRDGVRVYSNEEKLAEFPVMIEASGSVESESFKFVLYMGDAKNPSARPWIYDFSNKSGESRGTCQRIESFKKDEKK
jgi:hypothetical protein